MALYIKVMTLSLFFLIAYVFMHVLLVIVDERDYAKAANAKHKPKSHVYDLKNDNIFPKDSHERIFWYLQVTDIHLSKYFDRGRTEALLDFCSHTVPHIHPDFVIASGDLTDAKSSDQQASLQWEEEWKAYRQAIVDSGVLTHTSWFDIRGNHDAFNVPHSSHPLNYFKQYSVQGRHHARSYRLHHRKSFGVYSFIFIDATPMPGPKRPYNFYGFVDQNTTHLVQHFTHEAHASNMSVWIGHYTTSTVLAPYLEFKELIGSTSIAYLCGHLHTLGGSVPHMYSLQPQGFLELELGDWRDSRYYRVMAIDHDMFSFVDVHLNQWPVILITNPKDARFAVPSKEMLHRIALSTHVRMLVWSPKGIEQVNVFLDHNLLGEAHPAPGSTGPLYVIPWDTKSLSPGPHLISVRVRDRGGNEKEVSHHFTANGSPMWNFTFAASYILLRDQEHGVRMVYFALWSSLLFSLLLFRVASLWIHWMLCYFDHPCLIAAYRFSQNNVLFFPLLAYLLYTGVGPLMMGPLVEGGWGAVYLRGVHIWGSGFTPEALPYLTELFQLLTFVWPLYLYLIRRISHLDSRQRTATTYMYFCWHRLGYVLLVTWQTLFTAVSVMLPYGFITMFLSPCRFYLLPLSYYLLRWADQCPRFAATSLEELEVVDGKPQQHPHYENQNHHSHNHNHHHHNVHHNTF